MESSQQSSETSTNVIQSSLKANAFPSPTVKQLVLGLWSSLTSLTVDSSSKQANKQQLITLHEERR